VINPFLECAIANRWLYEIADLTGMRRAEGEHVKAFASRTYDRARAAYGHFLTDQPRRCVLIATTNDDTYLKSQTGNRRFWPVRTGGRPRRIRSAVTNGTRAYGQWQLAVG
jgi:predicted P-loop ATPase